MGQLDPEKQVGQSKDFPLTGLEMEMEMTMEMDMEMDLETLQMHRLDMMTTESALLYQKQSDLGQDSLQKNH